MNAEVLKFRACMSQTLHQMHQYSQFERICDYSGLLELLEQQQDIEPMEIAAVALAHFCTFGLFYETALVGILLYLGVSPGSSPAADSLVMAIIESGITGPHEFLEVLSHDYN
jgi:hypothetical protein